MGLTKLYFAKFFDEKGEFIKNIYFNKLNPTFKFGNKAYNVKTKEGSYYDANGILWDKRYYIYNISNPDPIRLDKKAEPILAPEVYNIMLETEQARKLNNIGKNKFSLNPKTIIIIVAIIGVVWWLLSRNGGVTA